MRKSPLDMRLLQTSFFQVVFVATAMSIVSGAVAERMKLLAFLIFAVVMTGFIYPMEGDWTWNGETVFGTYTLGDLGFSDFAGSGIVHMAGARCRRRGSSGASVRERASTRPMGKLMRFRAPTCHWRRSVPSSCGWDGSGFNGGSVLATATVS